MVISNQEQEEAQQTKKVVAEQHLEMALELSFHTGGVGALKQLLFSFQATQKALPMENIPAGLVGMMVQTALDIEEDRVKGLREVMELAKKAEA